MQKVKVINEIKLELKRMIVDEYDWTNSKVIFSEIIKITENIEDDISMFKKLLKTQNNLNNVNLVNKINVGRFLIS